MNQLINEISEFLISFKNKDTLENEIVNHKEVIKAFAQQLQNDAAFEQYKDKYLALRGYAYRLDNAKLRVYYTFKESVESFNLAQLTHNEAELLSTVFTALPLIDVCIDEMLGIQTNEDEKQMCKDIYTKQMKSLSAESQKYHMYQY